MVATSAFNTFQFFFHFQRGNDPIIPWKCHSYSYRFRPSPDQPKPSVFLKSVWLIWANERISVFLWLLPLLLQETILHVLFIDTVNCRHLHYLKFISEKAQILFAFQNIYRKRQFCADRLRQIVWFFFQGILAVYLRM